MCQHLTGVYYFLNLDCWICSSSP